MQKQAGKIWSMGPSLPTSVLFCSTDLHSQPSLSVGYIHILGFNQPCAENILKKKTPESPKKAKLEFTTRPSNYLYSIYIVLGILSNLEMI